MRVDWNYPAAIRFGAGRIAELADACRRLGMRRPLLVTDRGLARHAIVRDALAATRAAGLDTALFGEVHENPTGSDVEAGAEAFRAGRHDGVIAMGGGSGLDAGKSIALLGRLPGPLWRFVWDNPDHPGAREGPLPPIVTVATTAGTGADVDGGAMVTDERLRLKKAIGHPGMQPSLVIADPALTLSLPERLTAATGMDALSHNLEALAVDAYHPMADGIAAEGVRLASLWLATGVREPANLEARTHLMVAAIAGGTSFCKGLGAMHALSHPIGAVFHTHHGLTNAVLMPYVLRFNRPAIDGKMARLAAYLGLAPSFEALLAWVVRLRREIGIPNDLRALGLDRSCIDEISLKGATDVCQPTNPVPVGRGELARLLAEAIEGDGAWA